MFVELVEFPVEEFVESELLVPLLVPEELFVPLEVDVEFTEELFVPEELEELLPVD